MLFLKPLILRAEFKVGGRKALKKQGDDWEFSFGKYGKMSMKTVKSEENKEIEWKYSGGDMEDDPWKGSTVRFGLEPEGDDTTILRFSHDDLNCDGEVADNINYNWGRFMFSLKTFCEAKKGFPVEVE